MGIKLSDGRANLWQWDTGRHVSVDTAAREIHFSREGARSSHTVQIEDGKAKIPDHMLVTAGKLIAYVVEEDENGEMTVFKQLFDVLRRPKPEDYIYTEQEIKRWEQLEQRVDALEKEGIGDHTKLTNRDTADQHPIWAITGLSDALDNNSTAVLTATKTAQDAATAAGKAQTTADNAQTAAGKAQSTADAANATAEGLDSRITAAENELSQKQPAGDYLTEETDPTVPTWAKQPQKPTYTAAEVGALPRDTKIPSKVSELENDEKYAKTSELPQIDATLKQSGQAADAAETGKRIEAISPDDSTIDGKPWSSKQIIDTLCPPLAETGNPVQCYPVANYPLGIKTSWEPTQAGSGNPSPDNIRPISGRSNVQVQRAGSNLIDFTDLFYVERAADATVAAGKLVLTDTSDWRRQYCLFGATLPSGKYYVHLESQGDGPQNRILVRGYTTAGEIIQQSVVSGCEYNVYYMSSLVNDANEPKCIELAGADYYRLGIVGGTGTNEYWDIYARITDEAGYQPYMGQVTTLALPETIYGGEVDAVTGAGQEKWKIFDLKLAKISLYGINQNAIANFSINAKENNLSMIDGKKGVLSTSLPLDTATFAEAAAPGVMKPNETTLYIRLNSNDAKTPDEAKEYLASINAQIAYKLATPIQFEAMGGQSIAALSGVNTVLTDADSVTVTGRADPIKRITDLEDAVASMTTTEG